jgi:hypothetical protein
MMSQQEFYQSIMTKCYSLKITLTSQQQDNYIEIMIIYNMPINKVYC